MVLRRIRRGLDRFLSALDSEGVALFQALVYMHIILGGLYGTLVADGTPQAVEQSMGPLSNTAWLWLCSGAGVCLVGKLMRGQATYTGMLLQLAGDVFTFGALTIYVVAVVDAAWWGQALFAVWVVASIAVCVALLVVRDIRRLIQVEQRVRE